MYSFDEVKNVDPEVADVILAEQKRQNDQKHDHPFTFILFLSLRLHGRMICLPHHFFGMNEIYADRNIPAQQNDC